MRPDMLHSYDRKFGTPETELFRDDHRVRPEVASFGEWDTSNLGDRAINRGLRRYFRELGWRVTCYGFGSLRPTVVNDAESGVLVTTGQGAGSRLPPRVKRTLRRVRQKVRMLHLLPGLSRAQAISVGGGALLSDANLHFPQSLVELARASRAVEKPLFCLGCSAEGPWSKKGEKMIGEFLDACAMIAPRDCATARRIADMLQKPVPVFGDFCLGVPDVLREWSPVSSKLDLAVNVCWIPGPWRGAQGQYEDVLVALLTDLAGNPAGRGFRRIRIFTTGTTDDAVPARRVFARLPRHRTTLHLPATLDELTGIYQESALVLASRLHAAILAVAERKPVIGFSPAPKIRNFFDTMGIKRFCIGLEDSHRLEYLLGYGNRGDMVADQRKEIVRAPTWAGQQEVRMVLDSLERTFLRTHQAVVDDGRDALS